MSVVEYKSWDYGAGARAAFSCRNLKLEISNQLCLALTLASPSPLRGRER